jgi:hypothetical protein
MAGTGSWHAASLSRCGRQIHETLRPRGSEFLVHFSPAKLLRKQAMTIIITYGDLIGYCQCETASRRSALPFGVDNCGLAIQFAAGGGIMYRRGLAEGSNWTTPNRTAGQASRPRTVSAG